MCKICRIIFLFLTLFSFAAHGEAGVVAFALGKANVVKGEKIDVGKTIITGENGHVHIRFIDGALISMRPNSKLTVEDYQYDPDHPENNHVKFFLEAGVVRSVTGKAGKLNKKGFRMNTPISAIGIRGTDYTVYASDKFTRVFVKDGGVGLAPIDDECRKDGYGVCQTSRLVELFAGDEYIMELNTGADQARLISLATVLESPSLQISSVIGNEVLSSEEENQIPDYKQRTPDIGWANWSNYESILNQYFTSMKPYFNDAWRIYTMNSMYGLFIKRPYPDIPKTGSMSFELDRYQAFSLKDNQYELLKINNPSLSVNFTDSNFNLHFGASNSVVNTDINAKGTINNIGGLHFSNENTSVTGSFNHNLDQVGVLFEKTVDSDLRVLGGSAWIKK